MANLLFFFAGPLIVGPLIVLNVFCIIELNFQTPHVLEALILLGLYYKSYVRPVRLLTICMMGLDERAELPFES